jgi:hypothetical protein
VLVVVPVGGVVVTAAPLTTRLNADLLFKSNSSNGSIKQFAEHDGRGKRSRSRRSLSSTLNEQDSKLSKHPSFQLKDSYLESGQVLRGAEALIGGQVLGETVSENLIKLLLSVSTLRNSLMSLLKLGTVPLVGRKLYTLFAPFESK